jgi:hypothetical protein
LLPAQKELIVSNILPLKTLTSEINFIDPVYKAMTFGVKAQDEIEINITDKDFTIVEIIKTLGSNRNNQSIIADITNVFQQFFSPLNQKIGSMFDYSTLTANVLAIDGISSIRTKRLGTIDGETEDFVEGFSFYIWNPTYPELDKKIINGNTTLNDFEFLYFEGLSTIAQKFVIVENPYVNTRF